MCDKNVFFLFITEVRAESTEPNPTRPAMSGVSLKKSGAKKKQFDPEEIWYLEKLD